MAFGAAPRRELAFSSYDHRELAISRARLWNPSGIYTQYCLGGSVVAGSCLGGVVLYPFQHPEPPVEPPAPTIKPSVYAGNLFAVGLKADGTTVACGDTNGYYGIEDWPPVKKISIGSRHIAAVTLDGKVVCAGWSSLTRREFGYPLIGNAPPYDQWDNIVDVAMGDSAVVGLKADGTVVYNAVEDPPGRNEMFAGVSAWTGIAALAAGDVNIVGVKTDGTAVSIGANYDGQQGIAGLTNVAKVVCGYSHVVALLRDKTVVAFGYDRYGQCSEVAGHSGVADIWANGNASCLLMADGTVVPGGDTSWGQWRAVGWAEVINLASSDTDILGLQADGTVLWAGRSIEYGGAVGVTVSDWDLI